MADWVLDSSLKAFVQETLTNAAHATELTDPIAAALAAGFYKNIKTGKLEGALGEGWAPILEGNQAGGYDGMAFHHPASKTLVVVNRGTEGFNSFPDWVQNVGAQILDHPGPQINGALDLIRDGFKAAPRDQISQILICGHSLGGALADVQGALGPAILEKEGFTAPKIRTVGIASAGFRDAGLAAAHERGLTVDLDAKIVHYVRAEDAVPKLFGHKTFGENTLIASVYETRLGHTNGKMPTPRWNLIRDFLREHSAALYCRFLEVPDGHVWYSNNRKAYLLKDGIPPESWGSRPSDW